MSAPEKFPESLQSLLDAYLKGNISVADKERLMEWYEGFSDIEADVVLESPSSKQSIKEAIWQEVEANVEAKTGLKLAVRRSKGRQRRLSYRSIAAVAAAAMLIFLAGLWGEQLLTGKKTASVADLTENQGVQLAAQGHHGALLTLSTGQQVELDSSGAGKVATDGGATLLLADGKLLYKNDAVADARVRLENKVVTPKGKQFSLVLPDGTKVWLNAASSITYPVQFAKDSRSVNVTGEVYFEVAHLTKADHLTRVPFEVQSGALKIKVLGTHFDIRNYADENKVRTTLLEGQVSISYGANRDARTMRPGQQAVLNRETPDHFTVNQIDAKRTIAWKDGLFDFKDETLEDILKEVSRWYDIQASADPSKGKLRFSGVVSKRAELADLLNVLSATGVVHFKISKNEVYGY